MVAILHYKNSWTKHKEEACKQGMMMKNRDKNHKTQSLPVGRVITDSAGVDSDDSDNNWLTYLNR